MPLEKRAAPTVGWCRVKSSAVGVEATVEIDLHQPGPHVGKLDMSPRNATWIILVVAENGGASQARFMVSSRKALYLPSLIRSALTLALTSRVRYSVTPSRIFGLLPPNE